MIDQKHIDTPRLRIRPFQPSDAPFLVEIFADPMVHRYVDNGEALSYDDAILWVERSKANLREFGYGTGAIVVKDNDTPIGWAGFARPGDGTEELIYGFARAYWGKGYASEIVDALITVGRHRAPGKPLRATVDRANTLSVHLLVRRGFKLAQEDYDGIDVDLYILD